MGRMVSQRSGYLLDALGGFISHSREVYNSLPKANGTVEAGAYKHRNHGLIVENHTFRPSKKEDLWQGRIQIGGGARLSTGNSA